MKHRWLPMFPLGVAFVPRAMIPLHVFEERYRDLMHDVTNSDGEFGIVLIERGPEVGGGDSRRDVGTLARIVESAEQPDGRWYLVAEGVKRIRVEQWLEDRSYPSAMVSELDDIWDGDTAVRDELGVRVRRLSAMLAELGETAPPIGLVLANDPLSAAFQALAVLPVNPLDIQRALDCDRPEDVVDATIGAIDDLIDVVSMRLASG